MVRGRRFNAAFVTLLWLFFGVVVVELRHKLMSFYVGLFCTRD